MTKKKLCKCFTNTSNNPQGDSNKKDIIDFFLIVVVIYSNIDKVIKELNDSLNYDNLKNQAIHGFRHSVPVLILHGFC